MLCKFFNLEPESEANGVSELYKVFKYNPRGALPGPHIMSGINLYVSAVWVKTTVYSTFGKLK